MKALMEMEGAEVTQACNGVEALAKLESGAVFDLMLSDLGMPVMNGLELIARVRQAEHLRSLPVIALTGYGASQDKADALKAGFDAHVDKPVSFDVLQQAVQMVLERH